MYYRVPINQGYLDIDYEHMLEGHVYSGTQAVVWLQNETVRPTWTQITQAEFESYRPPAP